MSVYWWFVVILLTAGVSMLGTAAILGRPEKVPLDRLADPRPLPGELPRAGYLPGPPFAEPAPAVIPWDLAGAAYALGQQRADQDAVSREVEAIFAEVDANPERWQ